MSAEKRKQMGVLSLVVALVAVLVGLVLFVGATSGWFDDPKVVLDAEYGCTDDCEFMELDAEGYDELVKARKSFVVFVDQSGCTTADRLRGYVQNWADEAGVRAYRMMFAEMKESSLHDAVKYYPSFVVVSRGRVVGYLRADSDEDAAAYNDYGAFEEWARKYFSWN